MKNIISTILLVLLPLFVTAHDFAVNGIYYRIIDGDNVAVTFAGNSYSTSPNEYSGDVVIPETVSYYGKSYSVTYIDYNAFRDCRLLTSVTIPSSITFIGYYAFRGCTSLNTLNYNAVFCDDFKVDYLPFGPNITTINIGDSVWRIPAYFAYGLTKLTHITISQSVTLIGEYAFYNCSGITDLVWNAKNCGNNGDMTTSNIVHVTIGNEVETIPNSFANGSKITELSIPNSVLAIGSSAFCNCSGLSGDLIIPNSVTSIYDGAFSGCSGLTSVNIGNSVTSIGDYAFYNCSGLSGNLTIPNSVTSIGNNAFRGCNNLTSINIGNFVSSIGDYAFTNCGGMTSMVVGNGNSVYDSRNDCNAIIETASNAILYGCMNTVIPNSVTSIGSYAFYGCNDLTCISIPSSVNSIGNYAFYQCQGLTSVIVLSSTPPSGANYMFSNNPVIYVPNVLNYKNSSYWKAYNIQGFYSIEPQITRASIQSNNQNLFTLKQAKLIGSDGQVIKTFTPIGNSLMISDMLPNTYNNLTVALDFINEEIVVDDQIKTQELLFTQFSSTLTTQTTLTPTFTVNRDEGFMLDVCGVESSTNVYYGSIKESTNDSYIIECTIPGLTPNCGYSFRPWVQFKGVKYYGYYRTFNTSAIGVNSNATVTPTSGYLAGGYSSTGDAVVTDSYFTYNGERMKTLFLTGLDPNTTYSYTYTIETTTGNQVTSNSFRTLALSMVAQPVKMLTNTKVLFEAQTNMIDEETMVGFEWRRYDAPNEMPSTQVYSPVFGGKIAGTLKNLSENVYYKYRPFYTSNSGKSYYGNWVAFLTADAGVEYEPMVYTYNSPKVTQTDATLEGVALQGSDEITEQGFEYWKSGNSNIIKVTATGERMSKKISSLQSGTKYTFRAFLLAGGETHYGNEVEFVTLSNSLDVNLDGEINIADINMIIDIILTGKPGVTCDTNGDGEVNIADINTVIDAILSH